MRLRPEVQQDQGIWRSKVFSLSVPAGDSPGYLRCDGGGADGREMTDAYQDTATAGEGFGAGSVASPSWPGMSRPSTPRRRSADGRDTPGHDDKKTTFLP